VHPLNLPNLTGLTLLVVDDNDDNLDMLGTFLRACGAHVLQARNAGSALSYVSTTTTIDAIITDLSMPNMDGVELAQRVRQLPGRQSIPVIALTGFYEKYMDTHGVARFNAFLRKPVNLDELCKTVLSLTQSR
jgi:two-component system CheB/CheR fusion protein